MLSKFLKNFSGKKSRKKRKSIHENWFLDPNILTDNSTEHVSQSKKMKKSDCFIQGNDPNFFTIPESRSHKYGIMHYYSENY
ncbi:hypothetical protein [Enterococcus faecalis]|uniref:Uncharacterized protein n=1 Tax=Enterococcus faecalis ATCC 6055 TaxID=1169311 RepID=R3KBR8_ENTFL|nr:hypothetical protein [Enterococcus faecalis]EOK05934.1 hypothetical protein WOU_03188 [Enterococcus faecalis ATCC 6055]